MVLNKLGFRRVLRRNQTDAERKFWSLLRSRQLECYKFRRQHSIGPYIADFCCPESHLVIELDGGQHAERLAQDAKRTDFLRNKGYRVIRVLDDDVFKATDAVAEKIMLELQATPASDSVRARAYGWEREHHF